MKKSIFLIIVLPVFFALSAQAQLRFGVKAGVNIASVSLDGETDISTDNVTGFQVGPTIEWLFIKNFGIDAAVLYSQKGIKINNINDISIDKNAGYLDIPINAKLVLGLSESFKPYVAAGPYISFNLSGKDISDQWEAESFGIGVNVGAGIELFRLLQIGANYGVSLTDDYKSIAGSNMDEFKAKERVWSITAAVYF